MKQIAFRADSGTFIGSGHVMRCLTLADEIKCKGYKTFFFSRDLPGNLFPIIQERGHVLFRLPAYTKSIDVFEDAENCIRLLKAHNVSLDWVVTDSYDLDYRWDEILRALKVKILAIDDSVKTRRFCNILLNQNYLPGIENKYKDIIPKDTVLFLGPQFALINPLYAKLRENKNTAIENISIDNLLIFYGGSDPTNETLKALEAVSDFDNKFKNIDIIAGSNNLNIKQIKRKIVSMHNCNLHIQLPDLSSVLKKADLALGAGGSTTWERLCAGVPAIITTTADNQFETMEALARDKIGIIYIGTSNSVDIQILRNELHNAIGDTGKLRLLKERGMSLVDGHGVERIVNGMIHG